MQRRTRKSSERGLTDEQVKHMANRFLGWKLEISGDWLIWHDPLPINSRKADWCFVHKDFTRDNEDIRIGREESREMCLQTIDFIEDIWARSREEATQDQVDKLIMTPLVETVARIIDPSKWAVLDSYLADMLRKYKGEHIGYDPEPFKDKASMAKAQAAIAAVFDALDI